MSLNLPLHIAGNICPRCAIVFSNYASTAIVFPNRGIGMIVCWSCRRPGDRVMARGFYAKGKSDEPGWVFAGQPVEQNLFVKVLQSGKIELRKGFPKTYRLSECAPLDGITWLSIKEGAVAVFDDDDMTMVVTRGGSRQTGGAQWN